MRKKRSIAILVAAALSLTGCVSLPTGGPVGVGLASGAEPEDVGFTLTADGPVAGATPEQIVSGFIEAAITPSADWSVARQFLYGPLVETWRPSTGVTLDATGEPRVVTSDLTDSEYDTATEADVSLRVTQVGFVDATGTYTKSPGAGEQTFELVRDGSGEWRISEAADGIVLDLASFQQAYRPYALQFFDPSMQFLVPDVRWFLRRATAATNVTTALFAGPSAWLAAGVRTAFPAGVQIELESVPVDQSGVASVPLTEDALGLDLLTLSRMRTQLEQSLVDAGVTEVRFTVNGRVLDAPRADTAAHPDSTALAMTSAGFGPVGAAQIVPIPSLTAQLSAMPSPPTSVEMSVDGQMVLAQVDGSIYALSPGRNDELDDRPGLIAPTLDRFGFAWTVPADSPQSLLAVSSDVVSAPIVSAWPEATAISAMRVSSDGVRVAASVTVGGQSVLAVASVIRDSDGVPTELGEPVVLTTLRGPVVSLAWLGPEALGALVGGDAHQVVFQPIGGLTSVAAAPAGAVAIAGARTAEGARVLGEAGVLYAQRGATWQQVGSGILVLGTRSGY